MPINPAGSECPVRLRGGLHRHAAAAVLLVALGLTACATSSDRATAPRQASGSCSYYKVGEVREVSRSEVEGARRRMGGHFVRSWIDQRPGPDQRITTYSAEIFRYDDPRCAPRR